MATKLIQKLAFRNIQAATSHVASIEVKFGAARNPGHASARCVLIAFTVHLIIPSPPLFSLLDSPSCEVVSLDADTQGHRLGFPHPHFPFLPLYLQEVLQELLACDFVSEP